MWLAANHSPEGACGWANQHYAQPLPATMRVPLRLLGKQ